MADTLALEKLFADVQAQFVGDGTNAANVFGWRVPAQQRIGARIAWVPGDPGGNIGETGPARLPGRNPRPLATLHELFTVKISDQDPTDPTNELLQYKRTRLLRDAWHRAVYLAAHGTFAIKSESWIIDKKEARFGTALQLVCSIDAMIPDEPLVGIPVDTAAVITVQELDESEVDSVTATSLQ